MPVIHGVYMMTTEEKVLQKLNQHSVNTKIISEQNHHYLLFFYQLCSPEQAIYHCVTHYIYLSG